MLNVNYGSILKVRDLRIYSGGCFEGFPCKKPAFMCILCWSELTLCHVPLELYYIILLFAYLFNFMLYFKAKDNIALQWIRMSILFLFLCSSYSSDCNPIEQAAWQKNNINLLFFYCSVTTLICH